MLKKSNCRRQKINHKKLTSMQRVKHYPQIIFSWPGGVAQLVTCLTADPGVVSSILAWSHTFMEIDHEIIFTSILLPSADSRRVFVCYKRKYVHEVLVNCLVKFAQEINVVR